MSLSVLHSEPPPPGHLSVSQSGLSGHTKTNLQFAPQLYWPPPRVFGLNCYSNLASLLHCPPAPLKNKHRSSHSRSGPDLFLTGRHTETRPLMMKCAGGG